MERKFKSKLVSVKASEVRKQAIVQLKESIELSKFKQIEPIDYDSYINRNNSVLRKDACYKQLIVPSDDLIGDFENNNVNNELEKVAQDVDSLFVKDCLATYRNKKYEVKYKYHSYGGTFRRLPDFNESKLDNNLLNLPNLSYEIDHEQTTNKTQAKIGSLSRRNNLPSFEKNGWLNYKVVSGSGDNNKSYKKRYFHLRKIDSPIISRNHSVEPRYRKINSDIQESNQLYILEYFKEVPGTKRNEMPKNQIMFDSNIIDIRTTHNKNGPNSFEIEEVSEENNQAICHVFVADSVEKTEEWFNLLKNIIYNSNPLICRQSGTSFSSIKSDELLNDRIHTLTIPSSPSNYSNSSSNNDGSSALVTSADSSLENSNKINQLTHNLDLNKYLNENEDSISDLLKGNDQINTFDLYLKQENIDLFDEETELECKWPVEASTGQKLLLDFEHFTLNLNLPLSTTTVTPKNTLFKQNSQHSMPRKSGSTPHAINPELFYLVFALFDVRNNQKISENFYCIPNHDIFSNQINKKTKSTSKISRSKESSISQNCSSNSVFSVNGHYFSNVNELVNSSDIVKRECSKVIRRCLFNVVDVHDEIYLVARIEKCLDGSSFHSAVQPYLTQSQNENHRIKTAIKVHKKTQQLIKTKLANYRQPFAWAARPLYKKSTFKENGQLKSRYELDKDQIFSVYEQDAQSLSDECLLGYLRDLYQCKERKFIDIANADLKVYLNNLTPDIVENINSSNIIGSTYTSLAIKSSNKYDTIIEVDPLEIALGPHNPINPHLVQHSPIKNDLISKQQTDELTTIVVSTNKKQLCKKAQLMQTNSSFRSLLFVYPKNLKYDQQKIFSKARNILIKIEFREKDILGEDSTNNLSCIFDMNKSLAQTSDSSNLLSTFYYTPITHHSKNPQFYDEVKVLLPLNLTERHHLLFKFYHVSCSNAKSAVINSPIKTNLSTENVDNLDVETLIGFSWINIFKNGRLVCGEKYLPVAQSLINNYLTNINEIKWVENMKPLFKVNLILESTVHTTDPHVANFYSQCENLLNKQSRKNSINDTLLKQKTKANSNETSIPITIINNGSNKSEITIVVNDPNKEKMNNSIKALHATDLSTLIKYLPTLLNRIIHVLVSSRIDNAAIHAVRAILHFVWQITSIGKIVYLKAFIKYVFYFDYTQHIEGSESAEIEKTVHTQLINSLVVHMRQIIPLQDINQMNLIFKNCWFFLEVTLKSICLYTLCWKRQKDKYSTPVFSEELYKSLQDFYNLIIESIIKYAPLILITYGKDPDFCDSYRSCNRSLAMFIKKSLSILNKKFLFSLMNKYLESFDEKTLFELKFDFIRIICNHEHYIAFNLPVQRCLTNINEFVDLKHEFIMSDQFRQLHYLVGVLFSSVICPSFNDHKEQRRNAISILKSLICKHSYDTRYNEDKTKMSRIASLYLPLIDILIENISRLDLTSPSAHVARSSMSHINPLNSSSTTNTSQSFRIPSNGSDSLPISLNRHSTSINKASLTLSSNMSNNPSFFTKAVLNNFASGSASIFNGNSEGHHKQNETCSVLGVIAGLSTTASNFEGNNGAMISDTESLSSVDDSQFKGSLKVKKRVSALVSSSAIGIPSACNGSSPGNSDVITLNNSNSINNSSCLTTNELKHEKYSQTRKDKLDSSEIKDVLIVFVFVLRYLGQDSLIGLLLNYDENEFIDYLSLIELCLKTFRYRGKSNLQTLNAISKGVGLIKSPPSAASVLTEKKEEILKQQILIESNLCHQVGLVVLNTLTVILVHEKEKLCENHGDNPITKRLIDIYFYLLESNQSKELKLITFASLRFIINKASSIFLVGNSSLCANLCHKLLKCFNSRFQTIRLEAGMVLYLLLRKNYEFTKNRSISRVHSQTIISTSQLIGNMELCNNSQVLECLSVLNFLASKDKNYQNTRFSLEVQDLTKRIKNILQATSKIKNFQDDAEMLIDSQYSLAKSYGNSVELRRIWLDSMAAIHIKEENYSEAAHCYLHIAALVSQNLKHQGQYTLGCSIFKKITPNIELEEELDNDNCNSSVYKENSVNDNDCFDLNQVKYTQTQLLDYLCKSADMLKLGERYDNLPNIFKLAVAIYETNKDYANLQQMHLAIQRAYSYMAERDSQARQKPLGAYYRVSFYGQRFNDENNKVYIYKEPGNTKLFEITDRLRKNYAKQFGSLESVEILRDSRKPQDLKLDTINKNYIQIIHVQPYFSKDDYADRLSFFERNNNLNKFYYETPYHVASASDKDKDPKSKVHEHNDILNLGKKKIILETSHWFPYVKKRILVMYEKTIDLNPLETAIDELEQKIESFESILRKNDLTLLELYLQGAIIPQVHKGPLAYAEAFLEPCELNEIYSKELKKEFKLVFKQLIDVYQKGIELFGQLATKYNTAEDKTNKSLNPNNLKYLDMHCLLRDKFLEFENTFRNLLLVDGDFDLYQMQLNKSTKLSIDLTSFSQA